MSTDEIIISEEETKIIIERLNITKELAEKYIMIQKRMMFLFANAIKNEAIKARSEEFPFPLFELITVNAISNTFINKLIFDTGVNLFDKKFITELFAELKNIYLMGIQKNDGKSDTKQ